MAEQLSAQGRLVANLPTYVPAATEDEMVDISIALMASPEEWCAGLLASRPDTRRKILMKLGRRQAGRAMAKQPSYTSSLRRGNLVLLHAASAMGCVASCQVAFRQEEAS
jgi:hypothetical protein